MPSKKAKRAGDVHQAEGEEAEAMHLAETSDLSPNQARELIREHGHDRRKLKEEARNYKAES
jgi:hypothetical protein